MKSLVGTVKGILRGFGLELTRVDAFKRLQERVANNSTAKFDFLLELPRSDARKLIPYIDQSRSQIGQDLFAIWAAGLKRGGYFVEFGACDGLIGSNTYLLEAEFGWNGILAEPARSYHASLRKNRKALLEFSCVWRASGNNLMFNEIGPLSTLDMLSASDSHAEKRASGKRYTVQTISLRDLLGKHHAPRVIDYLSIDTEGSEFDVLSSFDFREFRFKAITCEHNYTASRERVYDMLVSKGYRRVFEELSSFEDWYVFGGPTV